MRSVCVSVKTNRLPVDKVWRILTDIEKYPERVKFVKKVEIFGTGEGDTWDDVTTILWIPIRIHHKIRSVKKFKEYSFDVPLRFGGYMRQTYEVMTNGHKSVILKGTIDFDLNNYFLDVVFGAILQKRLKDMLESSVHFVDGEVI